ncbi:MAG: outer membrane beta-barrel protein, partial [Pedosphaera parvula]|nr:outer membrane beta-barrel protein [Pedosphaera parvula]
TAGVCDGRFGSSAFTTAKPDTTQIYVGATVPTPIESLKVGVAWDHSQQAPTTAVNTSDADAIAGYVSWQATEKLKLNLRADYLDDGRDLLGFGASGLGAAAGAAGASAFAGEYFAATVTVDYALWANVISRLEYRWDHDLSGGRHFPGATAATGVNNANLLALNVIYKF